MMRNPFRRRRHTATPPVRPVRDLAVTEARVRAARLEAQARFDAEGLPRVGVRYPDEEGGAA